MYKFERNRQLGLADFKQPAGLKMNPGNRWVKKAETIPWDVIEKKYAQLFSSNTGMPAKPLRTALGSLLIQKQYGYSDRGLVERITENAYYQYFIGLLGFSNEAPYVPSLLVEFRKRLDDEVLAQIDKMIIATTRRMIQAPAVAGSSLRDARIVVRSSWMPPVLPGTSVIRKM